MGLFLNFIFLFFYFKSSGSQVLFSQDHLKFLKNIEDFNVD